MTMEGIRGSPKATAPKALDARGDPRRPSCSARHPPPDQTLLQPLALQRDQQIGG